MRKGWAFVLFWVALGCLGWGIGFRLVSHPINPKAPDAVQELEWLRREFQLSDDQFARIRQLHEEYEPICAKLCARVMDSQSKLKTLMEQSETITPEMEAVIQEGAALKRECQIALLQHIYRVSQIMPPSERRRYLSLVEMQVVMPGCHMGGGSGH